MQILVSPLQATLKCSSNLLACTRLFSDSRGSPDITTRFYTVPSLLEITTLFYTVLPLIEVHVEMRVKGQRGKGTGMRSDCRERCSKDPKAIVSLLVFHDWLCLQIILYVYMMYSILTHLLPLTSLPSPSCPLHPIHSIPATPLSDSWPLFWLGTHIVYMGICISNQRHKTTVLCALSLQQWACPHSDVWKTCSNSWTICYH